MLSSSVWEVDSRVYDELCGKEGPSWALVCPPGARVQSHDGNLRVPGYVSWVISTEIRCVM